jgi:hypothetical protein
MAGGHRLFDMSNTRAPLDVTAVRRDLVGPDRPWHDLVVVDTTGSTNADLLARHANGEDINGTVLIAEHQSAGRGRNGRAWSTPPRSQIALSVGVKESVFAAPASPSVMFREMHLEEHASRTSEMPINGQIKHACVWSQESDLT